MGLGNSSKAASIFEPLEDRTLYSVVTVTPNSNLQDTINRANSGDTVSFSAGQYHVNKLNLKAGVKYQGTSGATLVGPGNNIMVELNGGSGTEVTGLTFTAGMFHVTGGASVNVHDNTFRDSSTAAMQVDSVHDSHFDHNTFTNIGGEGVLAYPGSNVTIDYNRFDQVYEPIHALGQQTHNLSISHNYITHTLRHGIEIQGSIWDSKVDNNYMSDWLPHFENGNDSHMAMSLPTGEGGNNEADNNVLIQNGPTANTTLWAKSWLEIAGKNWTIENNYAQNWGAVVQNATGNIVSNNNIFVGVGTTPASSTDKHFGLNDSNAPKAPASPSDTGNRGAAAVSTPTATPTTTPTATPSSTPTATPTPTVSSTPTSSISRPTSFGASSPSTNEIDLSWKDNTGGKATYVLQRKSTNGSDAYVTVATLNAGTSTYKDTTNVQSSWEYTYVLKAVVNGVSSATVSTRVQAQRPATTSPAPTSTNVTSVAAPTHLGASSPATNEIDLSWSDNTGGTATYIVQRKSTWGKDALVTVATLPAGSVSYHDSTNIKPSWEYSYVITAVVNGVHSTGASVHAQAQVPGVSSAPVVSSTPAPTTSSSNDTTSTPAAAASVTSAWTEADLGSELTGGSYATTNGVYRVTSGTVSSSSTNDTSHFVYKQLSADGSAVAHVRGTLQGVSDASGLTMRTGLDGNSMGVSLTVDAKGNINFSTDSGLGSTSAFDVGSAGSAGRWLKLTRSGNTITGYVSQNSSSWRKVGSATLNISGGVYAGLTVATQSDGTAGIGRFDHVAVTPTVTKTVTKAAAKKAVHGLTAQIYSNADLSGQALTRVDSDVNFAWGSGTPDSSVTGQAFSVRWTGQVEPTSSGVYTFGVQADSQAQLWVNHKLVVDSSASGSETGHIKLAAGKMYDIELVYREAGSDTSAVSLLWGTGKQGMSVIPQSRLFAAAA